MWFVCDNKKKRRKKEKKNAEAIVPALFVRLRIRSRSEARSVTVFVSAPMPHWCDSFGTRAAVVRLFVCLCAAWNHGKSVCPSGNKRNRRRMNENDREIERKNEPAVITQMSILCQFLNSCQNRFLWMWTTFFTDCSFERIDLTYSLR